MDHLEKSILKSFINLMAERVSFEKVILFGSRARGDADPDSDMDVLVIVNELTERKEDYISECAWKAGFESGVVIVPIVFTVDEWETGPERFSLLAEAIRSEGVSL